MGIGLAEEVGIGRTQHLFLHVHGGGARGRLDDVMKSVAVEKL